MLPKQWIVRQVDAREQMALSALLSVSPMTASVLMARGVTTKAQADSWLGPHHASGHDPFLLPDVEKAVDRLHRAVRQGERICFYGDYDVDGMSATSLYVQFFRGLGADVRWYIPHRLAEGYGLNGWAIARLHGKLDDQTAENVLQLRSRLERIPQRTPEGTPAVPRRLRPPWKTF